MSEPPAFGSGRRAAQYGGTTVSGEQYQFIRAAYSAGYTARETQTQLQASFLNTRYQAILDVRREVKGAQEGASGIGNTAFTFQPSAGLYQPTNRRLNGNYQVWAHLDFPTDEPGVFRRYGAVVNFDQLLTRTEINLLALETLRNAVEAYGLSFSSDDIKYSHAYRRADG